jgi:predicted nucleic acid-binding protein
VKLLIDTNNVLDVVLERGALVRDSSALLDAVEADRATAYLSGHALTTIHYIVAKANGRPAAATAVADLLDLCEIVPIGEEDFQRALALGLRDFEDAVQVAAAIRVGADYLVSRNERDFKGVPIPVKSPAAMFLLLPAAS